MKKQFTSESIPIGTNVKLESGTDEDILENLEHNEYTVVGLVENPTLYCLDRGTTDYWKWQGK